ncbi:hypothetical protein ACVWXU_004587 [Streptomyces sp. TE33382]
MRRAGGTAVGSPARRSHRPTVPVSVPDPHFVVNQGRIEGD